MNPFKERRNDAIQATPRDPSKVLVGLVIRLKVQCFKRLSMDFFKTHELR
jgi:hypothetical protein